MNFHLFWFLPSVSFWALRKSLWSGSKNKHFYSPLVGCWPLTWREPEFCLSAGYVELLSSLSGLDPVCSVIFRALVAAASILLTSADKGHTSLKMKKCASNFVLRRLVPWCKPNQPYYHNGQSLLCMQYQFCLQLTKCCSNSTINCVWEVVDILHASGNRVAVRIGTHYLNRVKNIRIATSSPANNEDEIWNKYRNG